ncbi:hypothetical protein Y032_0300g1805 [Ancylostoma ceylanicum]|nr:hypothetical protein Y032_0300g1805 [Ancylostoma ceylanicum]
MLTRHIFLAACFVHILQGFVVKKQKPKDVLGLEHQRNRYEDNDHTPPLRHHPDAYGRLASWIQQNARAYLPIRHPQTTLDVHVSAGLYQIVDLDQKNNLATVSAYFDVWWMDEFLVWRPADYDGITKIFVPMKWVWKPEFYMYHSVYGRVPEYATDAPAQIQSDGRVRMFVSISSKSFCPINFKRFPFDSQTCSFSRKPPCAWKLTCMLMLHGDARTTNK